MFTVSDRSNLLFQNPETETEIAKLLKFSHAGNTSASQPFITVTDTTSQRFHLSEIDNLFQDSHGNNKSIISSLGPIPSDSRRKSNIPKRKFSAAFSDESFENLSVPETIVKAEAILRQVSL